MQFEDEDAEIAHRATTLAKKRSAHTESTGVAYGRTLSDDSTDEDLQHC